MDVRYDLAYAFHPDHEKDGPDDYLFILSSLFESPGDSKDNYVKFTAPVQSATAEITDEAREALDGETPDPDDVTGLFLNLGEPTPNASVPVAIILDEDAYDGLPIEEDMPENPNGTATLLFDQRGKQRLPRSEGRDIVAMLLENLTIRVMPNMPRPDLLEGMVPQ